MNKWKFYNPRGMQDILKFRCYNKSDAFEKLRNMYIASGFMEIETPIVEYYDVFNASGSTTAMRSPFKMIDEQGRVLTMRPDMTIPSARVASTKLKDEELPVKFFYSGKCFRNAEFNGGMMREFSQSGAEIIGSGNLFYDALIIVMAVEAIKTIGLTDFTIELGQVMFFKRLMEMANISEEEAEKIRVFVDSKDFFGVEEMLEGKGIDNRVRKLILNLPNFFGKKEMLADVRNVTNDKKLISVLDKLEKLLEILQEFGVLEYISVDLGMVSRLDYYTGIIFRGLTYGMGIPILSGGRYDKLCARFGKDMPATGFSLSVDQALTALYRNKKSLEKISLADSIICFKNKDIKNAIMIFNALKAQGLKVDMIPFDKSLEEIKKYASEKGIGGIILLEDDIVKVVDVEADTINLTDIETITGGAL